MIMITIMITIIYHCHGTIALGRGEREREREARVPGRENVRAIALSPRAQDKRDLSVVCLCLVHSLSPIP